MRKINLKHSLSIYNCRQVCSSSSGSKYGLSIKKNVFFINTLVLLYFLPVTFIQAQYQYNQTSEFLNANRHWAFGQAAGLEFSSGTAVPWPTSIQGNEGHATVSDRNTGAMLFYTDGGSVWNASHSIMPNGTGLLGNSSDYSTNQGTLIVPFINDSSKYYLFSLAPTGSGSLFYNIVDMTLDQGRGDIDVNNKNIVLDTSSLAEALIAIPGCNNDIWVLVHSFDQDPKFYKAYYITENGVNPTPVLSASRIDGGGVGSLAVSPDREKIALTTLLGNFVELSNFDPSFGTVTNSLLVDPETISFTKYYSAAFSPDNSKLYISNIDIFTMLGSLFQYEISAFDSASIHISKKTLDSTQSFVSLRLYNDTIYTTSYNGQSIHRVNQPNNAGAACDLELNAIALSGGMANLEGSLGNETVFPLFLSGINIDTIICSGLQDQGVVLKPNYLSQGFSYEWSTGDSTENLAINDWGIYWVKYGDGCKYVDSFTIRGSDLHTDITVNGHQLGTTGGPFSSYQWYLNGEKIPGATNPTLTVTQNGDYTVEITDEYGCIFMSAIYKVNNVNIWDLQQLARAIRIYPNPATEKINIYAPVPLKYVLTGIDGKELIRGDNTSPIPISSLAQGIYFLTVADMEGRVLKTEKIIKRP